MKRYIDPHLATFVEQQNFSNRVFNRGKDFKEYAIANLTYADRVELLTALDSELSPENLCCDGELRGEPLKKKTEMLRGAQAALLKLHRETYK